jgi:hypothetical protein
MASTHFPALPNPRTPCSASPRRIIMRRWWFRFTAAGEPSQPRRRRLTQPRPHGSHSRRTLTARLSNRLAGGVHFPRVERHERLLQRAVVPAQARRNRAPLPARTRGRVRPFPRAPSGQLPQRPTASVSGAWRGQGPFLTSPAQHTLLVVLLPALEAKSAGSVHVMTLLRPSSCVRSIHRQAPRQHGGRHAVVVRLPA